MAGEVDLVRETKEGSSSRIWSSSSPVAQLEVNTGNRSCLPGGGWEQDRKVSGMRHPTREMTGCSGASFPAGVRRAQACVAGSRGSAAWPALPVASAGGCPCGRPILMAAGKC